MTLRASVNTADQYVTTEGASPDIVTRVDRNLRFVYVSPTIERVTGLPPQHFVGKTHAEAGIPEPLSSDLEDKLRRIFESGSDVSVHFGFPDARGEMRHYHGVGVPETDESGEIKTILTVMRDITDERRAEVAQRIVEQQLMLLVEASAALLTSPHSRDVLRTIIGLAQRLVAADGHSVWGRDDSGNWHILSAAGLSEEYLNASLPASQAQEMRGPIVAADADAEPLLAMRREAYAREGIRSVLAIPLAIHNEPNGTVVFYWREPHQISEGETRIAQALGNLAAAALGTSRLYEREIQARERAQRSEQRSAFLAEAGALLNSSLDYEITLRNVAKLAVPKFADWCSVEIVDDKGRVQEVALHHTNPEMVRLAAEFREKFPPTENDLARLVLRTGKAALIERLPPEVLKENARSPEYLDRLLRLGIASLIIVPICINNESLGVVTLVRSDPENAYVQEDLKVAEEVGRRAGNAIAHSRLYRDVQASEERLRLAVDAAGLGIWERELDSGEIRSSLQNKHNVGVNPDEPIIFEELKGRIHKDDLTTVEDALERVSREGGTFEIEYRIWHPDGSLHSVLTYGRALQTELSLTRKLIGITLDVTERRQLLAREQEARRTAELLNSVGPVLLSQLEIKKLVPDMTEIAAALVGAEFGALLYGFRGEQSSAPGQAGREFEIGLSRAGNRMAGEEPAFGEWLWSLPRDVAAKCLKPGTGAARFAEFPGAPQPPPGVGLRSFLLAPVRSRGGDVLGSLVLGHRAPEAFHERHERIAMGISAQAAIALDNARLFEESRRARDAMEQSNAELRRVNEDLNQFAYSASHDLQEPLRMVAIYSQMLQRRYSEVLDERGKQYLNYAIQGAKRMELLVKDLLAYTQTAASGEGDAPLADTGEVLQEVLSNLQTSIEESNAVIEVGDLPPLRITAFHLLQIFQNLIGNAIKYRNPGELPRIVIYGAREGETATITVQDNGIGVPEEYRTHIFGLFRRLHSWDKYSGTGIGLAICQRLVERYGGRIWVDPPEGSGSVFRFSLPTES